jgi:hypothetical protein
MWAEHSAQLSVETNRPIDRVTRQMNLWNQYFAATLSQLTDSKDSGENEGDTLAVGTVDSAPSMK